MTRTTLLVMLVLLAAAPGWTATLESPANGATLSGIGFISGWKCDAGEITVTISDGGHIPVATGQPRADTRIVCGTVDNGFITQMNWNFLGTGTHTVVAYDDGVKFASSVFTVVTTGEEYLSDAAGECVVPDFPASGENARFVWNTSTQHLELVEVVGAAPDPVHGQCGTARNTCRAGAPNDSAVADTDTHYRWTCTGEQGGMSSGTCQAAKPAPPDPTANSKAALRKLLGTWRFSTRIGGQSYTDDWVLAEVSTPAEFSFPILEGGIKANPPIYVIVAMAEDAFPDYDSAHTYAAVWLDPYFCYADFFSLITPTTLRGVSYYAQITNGECGSYATVPYQTRAVRLRAGN